MRLTLNASETGHLVLATVHSGTCAEALQRIVSAFPSEMQNAVRAQLADCLIGVLCQRLRYRADLKIRVPECEILLSTMAVKNFIRTGDFFKIISAIETGAENGMWTYQRYQNWLDNRKSWHLPAAEESAESESESDQPAIAEPGISVRSPTARPEPAPPALAVPEPARPGKRIEIEPAEGGLDEVIRRLDDE